jgi:serine O-acetyltransferase
MNGDEAVRCTPRGVRREPDLEPVVRALCEGDGELVRSGRSAACVQPLPARAEVAALVEDLRAALFPGYHGPAEVNPATLRFHVGSLLDRVARNLETQVQRGFCFACGNGGDPVDCRREAQDVTAEFLARLPEIRRLLTTDVRAAYEGDPAARSTDEAILCYPGLLAVTNHRIANALHTLGVPLIPRMITEFAHGQTGIDIHPGATIGESFFIDHGTGVVIGETCRIGRGVRLYQGVTLGAKSFPLDEDGNPIKGIDRHPILEDEVVVYAGATVLGRVTIGRGAVIGGNVWVTGDVPPGAYVVQRRATQEAWDQGAGI